MTLDDALKWVEKIRELAGDDEAAHSEEDHLRAAVLAAIAAGTAEYPGSFAAIALSTSEIKFSRWCA